MMAQMMPMQGPCWGCIAGWVLAVALTVFIVLGILKLVRK